MRVTFHIFATHLESSRHQFDELCRNSLRLRQSLILQSRASGQTQPRRTFASECNHAPVDDYRLTNVGFFLERSRELTMTLIEQPDHG